jgi:alanine dehydrogenase
MTEILLLNQAEIAELLDADQVIDVLADGFRAISAEAVTAPRRGNLTVEGAGSMLTMQSRAPDMPIGTKLVSVFPGNHAIGIPSHLATIILTDPGTGATLALMDGTHITTMRTAGAAVLAAKLLARPDSRTMTILGAGVQGQAHLDQMARHFDLDRIFIGSFSRSSAEKLAARHPRAIVIDEADYEDAVRQSDIICLCSHAHVPLILNAWVQPGQHISSVGYAPPDGELDPAIAASHKLYVEAKVAFAEPPAGCAELAGLGPTQGAELGEVLLGRKPGRESPEEVTVYKAMGHAIEDLVVAELVYRNAKARSMGRLIDL